MERNLCLGNSDGLRVSYKMFMHILGPFVRQSTGLIQCGLLNISRCGSDKGIVSYSGNSFALDLELLIFLECTKGISDGRGVVSVLR